MIDLKKIDFTEPGLRQVELLRDFAPADITGTAKPLVSK